MPPPSVSRRSRRAARALCLAVAVLATACPEDRSPRTLPGEGPPPAGTVRLGYPEEPPTLNPVTDGSSAARDLLRPILPSFFLITPDLRYEPYLLAKEPEVDRAGDRTEVLFRIRDEATWSDGTPVTVADVAFTWRAMSDPGVTPANPTGFDRLADVVEDSPKVGRLVLRDPWPGWRDLFAAGRFVLPSHTVSSPEEVAGWDGGPPVTAGPFRLERWVRGRSVTMTADPEFWGAAPLVERIEVAFVPDPTTAIQLLQRGLLDAVAPMPGVSWGRRLDALPDVEVSEATGPDLVHLVMDSERLDTVTRQRIAGAVDRDRLLEVLLRGEAVAADGVLAPEQPGALPAWSRYRSGEPSPVDVPRELDLMYQRAELLDIVARYVQAELERAGTDVELVPLEADVFHGTFLPEGRFDLALVESRAGPHGELWRWVAVPGGPEPVTRLLDERLADLAAAAEEGDAEALGEAQRRLALLASALPLFQPEVTVGWRAGLTGLAANPTVDGSLWNAASWAEAV